jgi:hypothetical protein
MALIITVNRSMGYMTIYTQDSRACCSFILHMRNFALDQFLGIPSTYYYPPQGCVYFVACWQCNSSVSSVYFLQPFRRSCAEFHLIRSERCLFLLGLLKNQSSVQQSIGTINYLAHWQFCTAAREVHEPNSLLATLLNQLQDIEVRSRIV